MRPLLIRGGHIVDPSQAIDETGSLLITEGKIWWLGKTEAIPSEISYDVLSAEGLIVCPGFVDLHCHLREPGFEEKETIATGTRAAARGGFTTICCMPNTNPPLDNVKTINYVKEKAAGEGVVRVLPIGCVSRGRKGEELVNMDELAEAGVIGYSDDGDPVASERIMRQALEQSLAIGLPVIDHCEDKALTEGGVMNEGMVAAKLGLGGIPAVAEENIVARDLALAKLTGGRVHIAHVSTAGSVGLIRRARDEGVQVTAEVTPHHLTLTEDKVMLWGTNAKVNPPLRTTEDIRALVQGINDNVIDIIATDHAPHTEADKRCGFDEAAFGISGFETALGSLMGLVHEGQIELNTLISKLTCEPAQIIGGRYGKLGTLAVGSTADVAIFDPEREWIVDTDAFASKGKNTPLAGSLLRGRVMATIVEGEVVCIDEGIKVEGGKGKRGV